MHTSYHRTAWLLAPGLNVRFTRPAVDREPVEAIILDGLRQASWGVAVHFGLYLKNKGVITAEQLVTAIETQLKTRVPLGQLALEEGIISPRDIFDVLRAQREAPTTRFGEIAIEMGLMTEDELMRLLMIQSDRKRPVADILAMQAVLTKEQVAAEMSEYRRATASRRMGSVVRSKIAPRPRGAMGPRQAISAAV